MHDQQEIGGEGKGGGVVAAFRIERRFVSSVKVQGSLASSSFHSSEHCVFSC
jgi:hypothetical protein